MKIIKFHGLLFILMICNMAYSTEVIPPGFILLNISKNYDSVEKLEKHWAVKNSEFEFLKEKNRKSFLAKLALLKEIDPKSIRMDYQYPEKTSQLVKTTKGQVLEVRFKYTKHQYDENAALNFAGDYSFVSVSIVNSIAEIKKNIQYFSYKTVGYIAKVYDCPPCPKGVVCKPCMRENIVISDKSKVVDSYSFVGKNEMILFYENANQLSLGEKYLFNIKLTHKDSSDFELINFIKID